MGKHITDEFTRDLLRNLGSLNVERIYSQAIDVAVDEGAELLRLELAAERAPDHIARAIRTEHQRTGLTGAAGLRDSDPVTDDALEWELGALDGSAPPHGTFRFVADDMADIAAIEAARRFSAQIVGVA